MNRAQSLVPPTVLTVNGSLVAFHLHWEDLSAGSAKAARVQTSALIARQKLRYGVLHMTADARYVAGLYVSPPTQRVQRTYSACAWLAEAQRGYVLVIAELAEGQYWIGVRDQGVWVEGDAVGDFEAAALSIDLALEHFDRIGGAPRVLLVQDRPDGSAMATYPNTPRLSQLEVETTTWGALLPGKPPKEALVQQYRGVDARTSYAVLGLAAVAAAGFTGHALWTAHMKAQEEERLRQEWLATLEMQDAGLSGDALDVEREKRKQAAIAAALERHTATPPPEEVVAACVRAAHRLNLPLVGWQLSELGCDGRQLRATFRPVVSQPSVLAATEFVYRAVDGFQPAAQLVRLDPAGGEIAAEWEMRPVESRSALARDALPGETDAFRRLQFVAQMTAATTGPGWVIGAPRDADIVYLDPALENETDNPARFVQVTGPDGFRVGALQIAGSGLARLEMQALAARNVSVLSVSFRSAGAGLSRDALTWTLEAEYVLR